MKKIQSVLLIIIGCLALVACNNSSTTTTTTYSEALVTSLTFAANDSFPGLKQASFTIITATDTGYIFNRDSLLFGTVLDSVIPRFTFNHTPAYSMLCCGSDTIVYSGSDTVNMSVKPCRLYVMASDRENFKWYDIDISVHAVDPDLYIWEQLTPAVYFADGGENKAFLLDGTFYLFTNDGFRVLLYTSDDGVIWSDEMVVTGLPTDCSVRHITLANGIFYYGKEASLYYSANGIDWGADDYSSEDFEIVNTLCEYNDSLWCIVKDNSTDALLFATCAAGEPLVPFSEAYVLPDDFPVSDFCAVTFASKSLRPRLMVIGGYDRYGNILNTRWNVEFLPNRGYTVANFSIEQPDFTELSGVSVVYYNHELHLFGGSNKNNEIAENTQLVSIDEGLHWTIPDSSKNLLPQEYMPRQKATVLTDEDNYIYIIGGSSRTQVFSDVWRGRLNSTTFSDYENWW